MSNSIVHFSAKLNRELTGRSNEHDLADGVREEVHLENRTGRAVMLKQKRVLASKNEMLNGSVWSSNIDCNALV